MDTQTLKEMINNSTWVSLNDNKVFKFSNNREVEINGINQLNYTLQSRNNTTILSIDNEGNYTVDYLNDFNLKLYNEAEQFYITPY